MIYKTLLGIGIVIAGGIGLYNVNDVETYTAPEKEEVIEEVEETYPDDVIQEAQEAQNRVLRRFKTEQEITHIKAEIEAENASHESKMLELENKKEALEEELSF